MTVREERGARRRRTAPTDRAKLLIVSFDDMSIDPRVLKQVRRLVSDYDVTTCAPGPAPHPAVEHIALEPEAVRHRGRIGNLFDDIARAREWFGWTYRRVPLVDDARRKLRRRRFDVAIANDAETVAVASGVVGAQRVHADLHEYFPGLPVPDTALGHRQRRYWTWLIRRHAAIVRSSTTVGAEIAHRYREYGLVPGVVTNAAPFRAASPTSTPATIRLVHSGNPFRDRGLDAIMRAAATTSSDVTLDLYLTYNPPADRAELVALATELGPRIRVHEPVAQSALIEELSAYDVGIHVLPPTSDNNALALPNKFFDFIQARLGVIVGPSLEMARIVGEHGLGAVTEGFDEPQIRAVLDGLTPVDVDRWKQAADVAARPLSAEAEVEKWVDAVAAIVEEERPETVSRGNRR